MLCSSLSSTSTSREQTILISQILSTIRLPEACNARRIQSPCLLCTSRRDSKAQWCIVHRVNYHTLMLWAILRPSANMRLDNMTTVQKRHLSVRLHPDLISCVFCEDRKRSDVQSELSGLGELPQTGAQRQQLFAGY